MHRWTAARGVVMRCVLMPSAVPVVQDCGSIVGVPIIPPIITDTDSERGGQDLTTDSDGDQDEQASSEVWTPDDADQPSPDTEAVKPSQTEEPPAVTETFPTEEAVQPTPAPQDTWEKLKEMSGNPLFFVAVLIVVILIAIALVFLVFHKVDQDAGGSRAGHPLEEDSDGTKTRVL